MTYLYVNITSLLFFIDLFTDTGTILIPIENNEIIIIIIPLLTVNININFNSQG